MDLSKLDDRVKLIKDIHSTENKGRKAESLRQTEIFNDRIFDHVYERLTRRNNEENVREMPLVTSINLARRIVKQEASIYRSEVKREFSDLSDQQEEVVRKIYDDMGINSKMLTANESYKLQNQTHLMIVPKNGKLMMRVLRNHHIDSIDDIENPESASGYVISQLDKNEFRRNRRNNVGNVAGKSRYDSYTDQEGDFYNQSVGDDEDWMSKKGRYLMWDRQFNMICDGKGKIISESTDSPIPGVIPIIDISIEKDFEYWVRQGDSLAEFTIEYNSILSDVSQIVRMQGYAQAYLIAKDDLIPKNVQVGPNFLLKLPVEEGSNVRPEFGFASPGADINGSITFAETVLATFLTSRGLDPKVVSGSGEASKASSGVERLLMMIEHFEASRSDYDTFKKAEMQAYEVIKAWHNASIGASNLLDKKYVSTQLPESSEVSVDFGGPEMIKSDSEKVDLWMKRIEAGEATVVDMTMDLRKVDKEKAMEIVKENLELELGDMNGDNDTE